jgi:hypothetical protein
MAPAQAKVSKGHRHLAARLSPALCNTLSTATVPASQSMRLLQIPLLPSSPLTNGYLEASRHGRQPLCGSSEGWGPISPDRYDFTPCFLDVWIAVVAAAGILGGVGALWHLFRNCPAQPVKKNWHFYAKLVRVHANLGFKRPEKKG